MTQKITLLPVAFLASVFDGSLDRGSALPVGQNKYVAFDVDIVAVKEKQNDGRAVFKCRVIEGPDVNKEGDLSFNLLSTDDKVKSFAEQDFARFVYSIGMQHTQISDLRELLNRPFMLDVHADTKEENKGKGYVKVMGIYDINGNAPWSKDPAKRIGSSVPTQAAGGAATSVQPGQHATFGGVQPSANPQAQPGGFQPQPAQQAGFQPQPQQGAFPAQGSTTPSGGGVAWGAPRQ